MQRVLDGIRRIVQALRQASHEAERRTGLTAAQLFVLARLGDDGCQSLNELAERTFTHQSTVSTVVSRLVAAGLIQRTPAQDDRRRLTLALTLRGRNVLAAAPDAAQERLIAAIAALPGEARRLLGGALGDLAAALGVPGQGTRMFFEDAADGEGASGEARREPASSTPARNDTHDSRRPAAGRARAARRPERSGA